MRSVFAAALFAAANAGKIPLVHNPLTVSDLIAQKEHLIARSEAHMRGEKMIIKDYMNTQYFAEIGLGSDNQRFTVVPDTGSSNLWVYAHDCHSPACLRHNKYNPNTSSTYEKDGQDFKITYGSGSIDGYTSKDTCTMGDDITTMMTFGEIKKAKGITFLVSQMDGIIGLGWDTISVDGLPTFMTANDLTDKSFAFYLKNKADGESYMTMPGTDDDANVAKIAEHKVIEKSYWNLNMTKLSGPNGDVDVTGYMAAIDSGTSLIMGPNKLIKPLLEGFPEVEKDCSNKSEFKDITFTFDNTDYVLTPEDYIVTADNGSGSTQCVMGIQGADLPDDFHYMIVGDVFMRPYPCKFDLVNESVTFYK